MANTAPRTTLGNGAWPAIPQRDKPKNKKPAHINLDDLKLTDDPLPTARVSTGSKYEALFTLAMKSGKAIKTPARRAAGVSNVARMWLRRHGHTSHTTRSVSDYGDGHGRVWIIDLSKIKGSAK